MHPRFVFAKGRKSLLTCEHDPNDSWCDNESTKALPTNLALSLTKVLTVVRRDSTAASPTRPLLVTRHLNMVTLSVRARRCFLAAILVVYQASAQGARTALALHVRHVFVSCAVHNPCGMHVTYSELLQTHMHFASCAGWKCHCHAIH